MAQQHNYYYYYYYYYYYHNAESMAESAPVRCFLKIHAWSIIHGGPFGEGPRKDSVGVAE